VPEFVHQLLVLSLYNNYQYCCCAYITSAGVRGPRPAARLQLVNIVLETIIILLIITYIEQLPEFVDHGELRA
jgi:hypothetical protein